MYYIFENQSRPDGIVNTQTTSRTTLTTALAYYHERFSKMVVTELFTSVSLMLCDQDLNMIQHDTIETLYHE